MNTAPQRILIFSFVYFPCFVGGAEIAVKEITDRISNTDYVFDMISLRLDSALSRTEKVGAITIYRIGPSRKLTYGADPFSFPFSLNKFLYPALAFFKAWQLNRKKSYDATWAIMANYSGFAALFFKIFFPRVPFLLTLQEGDPIPYIKRRARFVYPLFRMIFRRANHIQAISEFLKKFALDMGFRGSIAVVPNGVDIKKFEIQNSKSTHEIKEILDIKNGDTTLITTSRLVLKNGVGDIIESLRFLPDTVKLIILGIGELEKKLRDLVQELHLQNRVQFLGYVPHNEMPKYLHVADIFIRPSLSEGFGNSFIEAMAAGIPVIATPVGGIVDFLTDKKTGVFCEVNNPKSIAEAVLFLLHNRDLRGSIVMNAKKMVVDRYDWDQVVLGMKSIFSRLTSRDLK